MTPSLQENDAESNDEKSYNIFRDGPVRYLGYANEVGESFRYQFPRLVGPSYVVAFGYCLADAMVSGKEAYSTKPTPAVAAVSSTSSLASSSNNNTSNNQHDKITAQDKNYDDNDAMSRAMLSFTDTLVWQSLASVGIPGLVINQIVKASRYAVAKSPAVLLPTVVAKWMPTAAGLGSIPLIIQPIDDFVDYVMDLSFRTIRWETYFSSVAPPSPPPSNQ